MNRAVNTLFIITAILFIYSGVQAYSSDKAFILSTGDVPGWLSKAMDEYTQRGYINGRMASEDGSSLILRSGRAHQLRELLENIDSGKVKTENLLYSDLKTIAHIILELKDEFITIFPDRKSLLIKVTAGLTDLINAHKIKLASLEANTLSPVSKDGTYDSSDLEMANSNAPAVSRLPHRVIKSAKADMTSSYREHLDRLILHFYAGKYMQAAVEMKEARKRAPEEPAVLFWSARLNVKHSSWERAARDFGKIMNICGQEIDPEGWGARDISMVIEEADTVVNHIPESVHARYWLASLHLKAGNRTRAAAEITDAIDMMKNNP